ncbi:MAG: hypothetical protein IT244_05660, partial [Bacteroidia bacterium]|nr:hypothetical protein [Bacteroidia bacterium]
MKIKLSKKIWLGVFLFLMMGKTLAQVTVNVVLIPPYSPYFSDYLSYENKAIITIIKSTTFPNSIYLKGSIVGDNGVSLITKPGYKPGTPIDLPNVTTVMNGAAIGEYFTWENTELTGTTPASIIRSNGLPEGNYKVCITPYDYASDAPVGVESCTNFKIVQVEPPVLLGPPCETKVLPTPSQTVVFSWSAAPGAPPNVKYVLTMVELVNNDQNPNDALNAATTPPFFEKDCGSSTVNVYNLSDPKLTVGKSYAWRVQAYDPKNITAFRNNGISEACKFTYNNIGETTTFSGQSIVISTPNCNANPDTVFVSEETDAMWSWLWQAQIDHPELIGNPAKLSFGGRRPFKYVVAFRPGKGYTSKGTLPKFELNAKSQNLNQTLKQIQDLKLLGNRLKIQITAFDSAGGKLADTSSCDFVIQAVKESSKKQMIISGKLNYKFTNGTQINPANNTLLSFQVNPKKILTKSETDPIDHSRPYVTISTNELGEFSATLDLQPGDTATQLLGVFIRSPYYSQFPEPIKVNLSYQKQDPVTKKMVNYGQKDTMNLGSLVTTVYSYDLRVVMGKGFPSFYVDSLSKNIYNKDVSIDTLSINPQSKIKAGMTVKLYRKTKSKFIPYYEAGKLVKGTPDAEGKIAVAEGKTIITKNSKGEDETIVEFKELIVNMSAEDKYFIKAVIPEKKQSQYWSPYG